LFFFLVHDRDGQNPELEWSMAFFPEVGVESEWVFRWSQNLDQISKLKPKMPPA